MTAPRIPSPRAAVDDELLREQAAAARATVADRQQLDAVRAAREAVARLEAAQ